MFSWIGGILTFVLVAIIPLASFYRAICLVFRRNYKSAAAFAAVPIVGLICLLMSKSLGDWAFLKVQLHGYRNRIEAAVANGKEVSETDVLIKLGPPVTARFVQPGMLWTPVKVIVFDESGAAAEKQNLNEECGDVAHPLGNNFYLIIEEKC